MNIALIGPSLAGKGTHAPRLCEQFNLKHISTGDLFRTSLKERTAMGLLARKYMQGGELVPDEVINAMLEECLFHTQSEEGLLFDGVPRTRFQVLFFDAAIRKMGRSIDAVVYIDVNENEALSRLPGRRICSACQRTFHTENSRYRHCGRADCSEELVQQREDDFPEIAQLRNKNFYRNSVAVVQHYHEQQKLYIINGNRGIAEVRSDLENLLNRIKAGDPPARATDAQLDAILARKSKPVELSAYQSAFLSLDLVLLGAPGSGKGTQAEHICKYFNIKHIATGDLFRMNLREKTPLGKLAQGYMDRGELVPDDITEAMVRDRLMKPDVENGFLLDGFPRNLAQAEALTDMLTDLDRRLDAVVHINVDDREIIKRLSGRMICRQCQTPFHKSFNPFVSCPIKKCSGEHLYQRDDDVLSTVLNRLKTYHGLTAPLIEHYRKRELLVEIPGEGNVKDVTARTLLATNDFIKSSNARRLTSI